MLEPVLDDISAVRTDSHEKGLIERSADHEHDLRLLDRCASILEASYLWLGVASNVLLVIVERGDAADEAGGSWPGRALFVTVTATARLGAQQGNQAILERSL